MPPEASVLTLSERAHEAVDFRASDWVRAVEDDGRDLLRVEGLSVAVGPQSLFAVRDVSFRVRAGEAVGIVGESGSGKTLTCRAILGALAAGSVLTAGSIALEGASIVGLSPREWQQLHGTKLAAVFQDPASYLNPSVSVGHQLSEVLRVKLGLSRAEAHARAIELFRDVELKDPEHVYHQLPAELSGGMIQRVAIAIAISCDPALLVADEATTALDVTVQAEVIDLLAKLRRERGLALLFVSHDLGVISEVCDSVVVFYSGQIVEQGPVQQLLSEPRHPYTQALVRIASAGLDPEERFATIEGQPPALAAQIEGCRFAARCPFAEDRCRTEAVDLRSVGVGHVARCVRVAEVADYGFDVTYEAT
jgi:peptide/nickel transport system ATP-binding protein